MAELREFSHDEIREITKDFAKKRQIGDPGGFGQVYKGRIRSNKISEYSGCPRKLAVKVGKLHDESRHTQWKNEIDALRSISHKNVIRLVGYAETQTYHALVYERAKGDLLNYTPSDQTELDEILVGLATGLEAVHSAGFIHWDFQLRNLLLMKDRTVKIADFGLASRKGSPMTFWNTRRVGVFNPNDTEAAQEKFDVFCFGIVMRTLVLRSKATFNPSATPRRDLCQECCGADTPDGRPSMDDVASKLKDIQLDALRTKQERKSSDEEW